MKKTFLFLTLLGFLSIKAFAQHHKQHEPTFLDKVRFGGGLAMNIGNSYSSFSISPSAVYDFSKHFSMGLSATYMYVKRKTTISETSNVLGGSIIGLFRPMQSLQVSAEYENLKLSSKLNQVDFTPKWQPALYLGVEYVAGKIALGLRYDVLFNKQENLLFSSALSPVFRVYF